VKGALWFSAVFGALGIVAGAAMFVLVLTGTIEATGAPPAGVLSGLGIFGLAFAFILHATLGMLAGLQQGAAGLVGLFLLVFGLVGAIRRRRPWYTPLAGPALWLAAALVTSGAEHVLNWLGSVSDWDAAASWSATTGTLIAAVGQLPLWGIWIWRWTNAKAIASSTLDDRYARTLASVASTVAQFVGTIMASCCSAQKLACWCSPGIRLASWESFWRCSVEALPTEC
jgi:hypothetical protein